MNTTIKNKFVNAHNPNVLNMDNKSLFVQDLCEYRYNQRKALMNNIELTDACIKRILYFAEKEERQNQINSFGYAKAVAQKQYGRTLSAIELKALNDQLIGG